MASMEKSERKTEKDEQHPWYESNLWLWGPFAFVIAIIGLVLTMKGEYRWMLGLLPLMAIFPILRIAKKIGNGIGTIEIFIFFFVPLNYGVYGLYQYLEPPSPIAVSPSKVELAQLSDSLNQTRGYINLDVYNRSDDPHYDVWVKLLIRSDLLMPEILDIDFPTIEERSLTGKDVLDMAVGSMCLGGKDKHKHPAFLCVIDKLEPKGTFKIKLTSPYSIDISSPDRIGHLLTDVVEFSDVPGKHFNHLKGKPPSSGAEHAPPEPFQITTMFHFCPDVAEVYKLQPPMRCTPNSKYNLKGEKLL